MSTLLICLPLVFSVSLCLREGRGREVGGAWCQSNQAKAPLSSIERQLFLPASIFSGCRRPPRPLANARSCSPLPSPSPHHGSFFEGAFPLSGKFLVTTLLISPVVNVLPWESGQEVSQTWRWAFWGIALPLLAPSSSTFPLFPPKIPLAALTPAFFLPLTFTLWFSHHVDHYGSACWEL